MLTKRQSVNSVVSNKDIWVAFGMESGGRDAFGKLGSGSTDILIVLLESLKTSFSLNINLILIDLAKIYFVLRCLRNVHCMNETKITKKLLHAMNTFV